MAITTVDLSEVAAQLRRPFEPIEAAQVDELGVYVYVSHGRFAWHRHLDEDELFLVLNGMVAMDSEWGSLTLHAGELVVMPKGVGHRSSSPWRAVVLLLRPKLLAHAQNGKRRLYGLAEEQTLQKVVVGQAAASASTDFRLHPIAQVGAYSVALRRGTGHSPWEQRPVATLIMAYLGRVLVESTDGQASLISPKLAVVSAGTPFRLSAAGDCVCLQVGQGS
ncbi:MAG: cupin domain-containing protein [Caldilineales bacterium]|nr:cupin domain-containing protein [Caldilineales bacterium]MDW8317971.1 cupin domain-containing protein [Anaerolineae bacterium]